MISVRELAKSVIALEVRNSRVELDKKWETSFTRKFLITVFTFLSIGIYMWAIGIKQPWLNAIVPTLGFTLSTLSLTWFRKLWEKINTKARADKLIKLSPDLHELLDF